MALKLKHLTTLAGTPESPEPRVPLPEPWGVVYASANTDGTRKACENCVLYSAPQRCAIHAEDVEIGPDSVCGYHVFGAPGALAQKLDLGLIGYVEPEYSGLIHIPGGTSCDRCRFFEPLTAKRGLCNAVVTPEGTPAPVEALACCARWEIRDEAKTTEEEGRE